MRRIGTLKLEPRFSEYFAVTTRSAVGFSRRRGSISDGPLSARRQSRGAVSFRWADLKLDVLGYAVDQPANKTQGFHNEVALMIASDERKLHVFPVPNILCEAILNFSTTIWISSVKLSVFSSHVHLSTTSPSLSSNLIFQLLVSMPSLSGITILSSPWGNDPWNVFMTVAVIASVLAAVFCLWSKGPKHPKYVESLQSISPLNTFKSRLKAWAFLLQGNKILQEEFERVSMHPFMQHLGALRLTFISPVSWRTIHN